MTVTTHIEDALERATTEREHVERKRDAFERFRAELREIDPVTSRQSGAGIVADGGMTAATAYTAGSGDSRCRQVRGLFEEIIGPVSTTEVAENETTVETIRGEFCEEVALALSPQSDSRFTPGVKQAVVTAASNRRQELGALGKALAVECESLSSSSAEITEMTDWLAEADQTPLMELGFEQLRERHERLSAFQKRCEEIAASRQETLQTTTSYEGSAGIEHAGVVEYLYDGFPTTHPVLTTTTNLSDVCADCQRAVRDHLTRRV